MVRHHLKHLSKDLFFHCKFNKIILFFFLSFQKFRFKSPLIQNLLNKARNTKSTDNLTQSSMTTSQIVNENVVDEDAVVTTVQSTTGTNLSDDDDNDDQQDSEVNNTSNGYNVSP